MDGAIRQQQPADGGGHARIDGRIKVTGECSYAADIDLEGLVHGVLVTSPIARGKLRSLDVEQARAAPGVLEVLQHGDMEGVEPPQFSTSSFTSLGPLHQTEIAHDGQIVALVVAETYEAACEGAELVGAEYERTLPAGTLTSDGAEDEVKEDKGLSTGNFEQNYAQSVSRVDCAYRTASETHNPIELFSTTCRWEGDRLTVYEPTQNVYGFRGELARQLGLPVDHVRVVSPYVGGGFGSKGPMTPRTAIVAVAARRLGRPVRCVVSRMQGFTTTSYRAETRHRVRLAADADGHFTAYGHEGWELTSRTDDYLNGGTDTTARMYGFGSVDARIHAVRVDRQTPGYMRSPPETPYMYALECAIDELAHETGMDPIDLRRINDTGSDPVSGNPFSSRSLMECFDAGSAAFDWSRRVGVPGSVVDGDWRVGLGCATACYPTHVAASTARIRVGRNGHVTVECASHEIGTGIRTVAALTVAEQLGTGIENVTVEMGDTDLPPAPVSGGSNSTASVCSALIKACSDLRRRLGIEDLPQNSRQSLGDRVSRAGGGDVEAYAEFIPDGAPEDAIRKLRDGQTSMVGGHSGKKLMYAFGAVFAEVHVHRYTCEMRVPRLAGAFAAGRIVNPRTARSQLMGGMIWGMSCALHEETQIDPVSARYVNRDLQDYLVPVNADVGEVDVIFVPETDTDVNPAGVKGLGELGNVGMNAAVANAVFNATGKRIRDLPIRLEALLD